VRELHPLAGLPLFHGIGGVVDESTGALRSLDDMTAVPKEDLPMVWCLRFMVAFLNDDYEQTFALYMATHEQRVLADCVIAMLRVCAGTIAMIPDRPD